MKGFFREVLGNPTLFSEAPVSPLCLLQLHLMRMSPGTLELYSDRVSLKSSSQVIRSDERCFVSRDIAEDIDDDLLSS